MATTVTPGGVTRPQPGVVLVGRPRHVLLFSLPDTARTRNIEPIEGVAQLRRRRRRRRHRDPVRQREITAGPAAHEVAPYVKKYAWGFERLRATPQQFAQRYSVPIRIRLTKVRGHR